MKTRRAGIEMLGISLYLSLNFFVWADVSLSSLLAVEPLCG